MCYPSFDEVKAGVSDAFRCFYPNNVYLVHKNAHERSMTFRLGRYLQQIFLGWNVDCEYNKNCETIQENKLLTSRCTNHIFDCANCNDRRACTVFPDIIIHKRETKNNLLVIEAKIKNNLEHATKNKIEEYLTEDTLGYQYGLFVSFEDLFSNMLKKLRWCRRGDDGKLYWYDNNGKLIKRCGARK